MKTLIVILSWLVILPVRIFAADTNSMRPPVLLLTNETGIAASSFVGNLTPIAEFDPTPVSVDQIVATNGFNSWLTILREPREIVGHSASAQFCYVYVYNYTTNYISCLRLPLTELFDIALLDKEGKEVQKTKYGKMFGVPLSQSDINDWYNRWNNHRLSQFIRLFPNGLPEYADTPTDVATFIITDAFDIETPGNYELHLRTRFVQVGRDSSGILHFPVTWLPEVASNVVITPEDIK